MILFAQSSNDSLYIGLVFIVVATIITIITLLKYSFEKALQFWAAFGTIIGAMTTYFFTRELANKAEQRAAVAEKQSKEATDRWALAAADAKRTELLLAEAGEKVSQAEQRAAVAERQSKDATDRWALAEADARRTGELLAYAENRSSQLEERQAVLASTREGPPVQDSPYAISYEEFRVHARNHDAVIVDARDPVPYSLGHVQGAINIPAGEKQPYRDRYLKNVDSNQLIMIYCNSASCHSSDMLAEHLIAEGFTNVRVFTPGWQVLSARLPDLK